MMVQKYLLLFFSAVTLFCACAEEQKSPNQKLASAYCDCTAQSELVKLNKEAQTLMAQEQTDQEAITDLLVKIESQHQQLRACLLPASNAFGKVKATDAATFRAELRAKCPETDSTLLDVVGEWLIE